MSGVGFHCKSGVMENIYVPLCGVGVSDYVEPYWSFVLLLQLDFKCFF